MEQELRRYLMEEILPKYDRFDEGHDKTHVDRVLRNARKLAEEYGADQDMVEVIALYRDIGLEGAGRNTSCFPGSACGRTAR